MAQQIINRSTPNDDNGDSLYDGAGKINDNFTELYGAERFGVYNYDNSLSPISVSANTWTLVTNNGGGANTITTGGLTGVNIYNTSTNQFSYTGLSLFDTIDYRFDTNVTTTSANQVVRARLLISVGNLNIPLTFASEAFKTSGTYPFFGFIQSHLFTDLVRNNPAQFEIWSDSSVTVDVNGWAVKAIKRTI